MKFKNGQLPTWYVVKRLMADEELYATAPNTDDFFPCTATTDGIHIEFITHFPGDDGGDSDGSPPKRFDWTLKRKGGGRANKRDEVVLGRVETSNTIGMTNVAFKLNEIRRNGTYEIVARKVK